MTQHLDEANVEQSADPAASADGAAAPAEESASRPAASDTQARQPGSSAAVPTSASRRVRARLARRMTGQRGIAAVKPVLEPLATVHRELYPKANLTLLQRAFDVAERAALPPVPQAPATPTSPIPSRSPTSSPNSAWTPPRWSPRCCTTPSRTPATRSSQLTADFGAEVAPPRRRRHQAGQGQPRRGRGGRDHPQDDHRDGPAIRACW